MGFDVGIGRLFEMIEEHFGRIPKIALLLLVYVALCFAAMHYIWIWGIYPSGNAITILLQATEIDWLILWHTAIPFLISFTMLSILVAISTTVFIVWFNKRISKPLWSGQINDAIDMYVITKHDALHVAERLNNRFDKLPIDLAELRSRLSNPDTPDSQP